MSEQAPAQLSPEGVVPFLVPSVDGQFYKRWELDVRCSVCNKLFFKFFLMVGVDDPDIVNDQEKLSEYLTKKGIDVKVGLETWCRRHKAMDYRIIAVGQI